MKKWVLSGLIMLLVGCSGPEESLVVEEAITCHAAYRSSAGPIERETLLSLDKSGMSSDTTFSDMALQALYSRGEGEGGRALALRVTTVESELLIASQLYQFAPGIAPQNEFIGGHGFTGLNYAYHPASGAELQYWCTAGRE